MQGYLSHRALLAAQLLHPRTTQHLFKYLYLLHLFPLVPGSKPQPTSFHLHGLHGFLHQLQGQWHHCLGQDSCGPRGKSVLAQPRRKEGWPLNISPSCGPSSCSPLPPCYSPSFPVVSLFLCSHLPMGFVGELSVRSSLAPVPVITHASTLPPEPRSPRIPAVMASTSSSSAASSCGKVCEA